ncbi:MAG TPA: triose-phosphate isomerase [Patescibacteria group bacterium]|jgi:triosephosphate isomerase
MQKLIVANWKANKSLSQAQAWLETVASAKPINLTKLKPIVAPAFSLLPLVESTTSQLGWQLAAQDISPYPAGSYTGAVSVVNLQGLALTFVIIGHSERREHFGETVQQVARKAEQVVSAGMTPMVCVSEQTLTEQASALDAKIMERCVVVYEPPSAIGSGDSALLSQVSDFQARVKQLFGSVPFLYGGSVDEQNIGEYLLITDGVVVGTASLSADQFINLLQTAQGDQPSAV